MLDIYKMAAGSRSTRTFVYLHQTPMFHAASLGGMLAVPAVGGQTTFVPLFEPAAVLDTIERHQVTMTVMVPTMVAMLLDHPDFGPERLASLEVARSTARRRCRRPWWSGSWRVPDLDIFQGYGMTENCGLLTCLGPEEHRRGGELLRSAGRPMPGSVVDIQDPGGDILPAGESGEVCAQAGNHMREYWNRPDETAAAFRDGGTTPVTPATSTSTAISTWSIGSRT